LFRLYFLTQLLFRKINLYLTLKIFNWNKRYLVNAISRHNFYAPGNFYIFFVFFLKKYFLGGLIYTQSFIFVLNVIVPIFVNFFDVIYFWKKIQLWLEKRKDKSKKFNKKHKKAKFKKNYNYSLLTQ